MTYMFIALISFFMTQGVVITEDFNGGFSYKWCSFPNIADSECTWWIYDGKLCTHNILYDKEGILKYLYLNDFTCEEFIAEVDIKIQDSFNGRFGIIFGHKSGNFFRFRIFFDSQIADFYYHTQLPFNWFLLEEKKVLKKMTLNEWYRLKVVITKTAFSFYIDDVLIFDIRKSYYFKEITPDNVVINEGDAYEFAKGGQIALYAVEIQCMWDNFWAKDISCSGQNTYISVGKLKNLLDKLDWAFEYREHVFDCSNCSAALCVYLNSICIKSWIVANYNHAWVRSLIDEYHYVDIEAITISINWDAPDALYEYYDITSLITQNPCEYGYPEHCLYVYAEGRE